MSAREAWIEAARSADILAEAEKRGAKLKRLSGGREWIGACPVGCCAHDGFSVNTVKRVFLCRRGGAGGDVIELVEHLDGVRFLDAVAILAGPPPGAERADADFAAMELRERERRQRRDALARQREAESERYREGERGRAYRIWGRGVPIAGTPAEAYLVGRGLDPRPTPAVLRYVADQDYWPPQREGEALSERRPLFAGPAMLAAITGADGRFAGVHMTWIDAARPGSKREIADPATGELLAAKKVRGTLRRASIKLLDPPGAVRLVVGEGIETVLSVAAAEAATDPALTMLTAYWSAVSLGHLGGRAADRAVHPTLRTVDRRGRTRHRTVPGSLPADDDHVLMPPERFAEILILGDGDSERFETQMHLWRAAARWALPGRTIAIAWAPEGQDFNNLRRVA